MDQTTYMGRSVAEEHENYLGLVAEDVERLVAGEPVSIGDFATPPECPCLCGAAWLTVADPLFAGRGR